MQLRFQQCLFLSVFIFCTDLFSYSQNNSSLFSNTNFPFDQIEFYNSTNGLNGNEVSWMTQDKNGFLWFITDNALNRFDGYTFRSFGYNPADTNSISTGWYFGLKEDNNGVLWFPDEHKGLHSFNPLQQKFMTYPHQNGRNMSPDYDNIHSIVIEDDSLLWVATPAGLDRFNQRTKKYTNFINYSDPSAVPFNTISSLEFDKYNMSNRKTPYLWLTTDKGLACFNTQSGKLDAHYDFPFSSHSTQWYGYINLNIKKSGIAWIGSDDNGLYGFNTIARQYIRIKSERRCQNIFHHINGSNQVNGFFSVLEDHLGNLWTINDNNEIVYYDTGRKEFYYLPLPENRVSFLDLPPYIFEDKNQKIWFCTATGIIAIDTKKRVFYNYQNDPHNFQSVSGNFICNIYRSKTGTFFASANALDTFNKLTKSFSRFLFKTEEKEFNTYGTWGIYEDSKGNIWLAGNYGLYVYNPLKNISRLLKLYSDEELVENSRFIGVVEDNNGKYWASTSGWGLYKFDPETGKTKVFASRNKANSISTDNLTTIHKDSKGLLYIGTWQGGLIVLDPDKENFTIYRHDPNDPSSISNESTHLFYESKNGFIWFGTLGGGLNVFDRITQKFKTFTTDDGLAHNSISSIQEDKNGDLWVSTRGGISRFTPPENPFKMDHGIIFKNYDLSDGLPSNQFNMNSSFCDLDGTIYFGSRGAGLIYFHPDSLKQNTLGPPVFITGLNLHNKPIDVSDKNILNLPIEFTKEIKLNYRQNIISFTFAALNYIHPEKNKYAYMLENYNKNWIVVDASKRFANYTNLNPGTYIFKVKAANNDGIWNDTAREIKIIITPPFWQTLWFKIFAIIILISAVFLLYKYRLNQILKLQKIRNKIAADLHDDIGSTLNSISIYSEVAKQDKTRRDHALSMIGESSRKIIDSISDIVWAINPQNDSFDKIIFRMKSLTHNLLKAKKIDCTFKTDESVNNINLPMEIRKNFYLIFKEALNNLVKYSEATKASVFVTQEGKIITFFIRDNGIGFNSLSTPQGNGISNMKRRAEEINADLHIESYPGNGTSVQLNLKL